MERQRVLIAEDNPEMCQRFEKLLGTYFQIVGSAADGQQAIDSTLRLNPDVLVTDISMPIFNGLQVASRLRDLGCRTKLIFVTVHDDDDLREAAFSLGAFGYVLKARIDTDLIAAIEGALRGQRFPTHFPAAQI